jgi:hypothetical protein
VLVVAQEAVAAVEGELAALGLASRRIGSVVAHAGGERVRIG